MKKCQKRKFLCITVVKISYESDASLLENSCLKVLLRQMGRQNQTNTVSRRSFSKHSRMLGRLCQHHRPLVPPGHCHLFGIPWKCPIESLVPDSQRT
jgi:hypothetical protein